VYRKTVFSEAQKLYEDSLGIIERTFREEHPEVTDVCNALGMLHKKEGRNKEASHILSQNGIYLTN